MEITIKMPTCLAPRLIEIKVSEGDRIVLGDILFSYESDGALMFEYSACSGTVVEILAAVGRKIRIGDPIMVVDGDPLTADGEMFPPR